MYRSFSHFIAVAVCGGVLAVSLAGCERPQIRVYTIAKEIPAAAAEPGNVASRAPRARPQVTYNLPAGWQDAGPTALSLANFRIQSAEGEATVNITPLAGMAGRETAIINMWREQVGLPSVGSPGTELEFAL